MTTAFILINTEIGADEEIVKVLRGINGVTEVHQVYGVFDIIAKIEHEDLSKLKEIITWEIRRLQKVRSTLSMLTMD